MTIRIAPGNNAVVELRNLRNSITNAPDHGAVVHLTIRDKDGEVLSGQDWPATLAHVGRGVYRVTLEAGLVINPLANYEAVIEAIGSGGERGRWVVPVESYVRTA